MKRIPDEDDLPPDPICNLLQYLRDHPPERIALTFPGGLRIIIIVPPVREKDSPDE